MSKKLQILSAILFLVGMAILAVIFINSPIDLSLGFILGAGISQVAFYFKHGEWYE